MSTDYADDQNVATGNPQEPGWYLDRFIAEADGFAAAIDGADLDAPVQACPGWDVAALIEHLGQVHGWAEFCAREARRPTRDEAAAMDPFDRTNPVGWYRSQADRLQDTLRSLDPFAPTWHPFPPEQVNAFWPRRQAQETMVHRWDAEHALGIVPRLDPVLASDGIDEYFQAIVPRLLGQADDPPSGSLHVHCTDVEGEWLVWTDDNDDYHMIRAHQKGDAALRGPAGVILLELWARDHGSVGALNPVGDEAVLTAWTLLGGN